MRIKVEKEKKHLQFSSVCRGKLLGFRGFYYQVQGVQPLIHGRFSQHFARIFIANQGLTAGSGNSKTP